MTWSYNIAALASTELYQVRLLIGDTNTNIQELQDEEINFFLTQEGNMYAAASICVQAIIAKYKELVDKSVADLRISYSQRLKQFQAVADNLANRSAQRYSMPYAGGISISDKEIDDNDCDRVPPAFKRGQFDLPGSDLPNGDYEDRFLEET
jgi:hypothetical protein